MATDPMLDPDYKYSINKFTGNGAQTSWNLNFSGGYIRREHVKAYTQAADGQITELSFTWSGPNTIVITPPVAMGVRLYVYRDTPKSGPLVDFTDGAIINEYDLDMLARQTVFATAEMVDRFADVAVQSEATTAVAQEALLRAADAQNKVALANSTSAAALLAAQGAVSTAAAAETKANAAVATANSARDTANAASGKADTAIATANSASGKADSALSTAATAAGQSSAALTTAQGSNAKADNAVARAISAQEAAAAATTTANGAKGTADQVRSEFDALADTVKEIAGGDLTNFVRVNQVNTFTEDQRFDFGKLTFKGPSGGRDMQIASRNDGDIPLWRRTNADGSMSAWAPIPALWSAILDKPTQFTPTAHNHSISEVTNLQTTLDAKASNQALSSGLSVKANLESPAFTGYPTLPAVTMFRKEFNNSPEGGQLRLEKPDTSGIAGSAVAVDLNGNLLRIYEEGGSYRGGFFDLTQLPAVGSGNSNFLFGANNNDAVLKSATNLGRTGGGPLQALSNSDMSAAPTGFNTMTAPGSATPNGTYGYFFKLSRRDNGGGWSGLWTSHQDVGFTRVYVGGTAGDGAAPEWTELARLGAPGKPINQNHYGVTAFVNDGGPAAEFWNGIGDGVRFGPKGGISFAEGGSWLASDPWMNLKNFTLKERDATFRDITASRGDGSGAIFLGGGAYLYHNTAGGYEFGGAGKPLNFSGSTYMPDGNRPHIGGKHQPKISVQSGEPGGARVEGDLWIW
ncbi:tail fiber protein [Brevundimonas phage AA]|uniref:Tail fiber protein n=1 Tax=Brevundimonas phage AA TaxID=2880937 RepID=A0AAN0MNY8_9CAUD|nr:tail fiber protein [Brevundimonas phage AA]